MMTIGKEFKFESAHYLQDHPKCGRIHGHTYTLTVEVSGMPGPDGMVIDLHTLSECVKPIIEMLDHNFLNTVPMKQPTTCENITGTIVDILERTLPELITLTMVKIQEGVGGYAIWRKPL